MVQPDAHRGDDDLGLVTNKTGRVEVLLISRLLLSHLLLGYIMIPMYWGLLPNHYIYRLGLVLLSHRTANTLPKDDQRVHDDDDDDDHDDDDDDDAGDEEEPVPMAPEAPTASFGSNPHPGKGKGLTGSFMSVMSKISGSHNKRHDKARDVPAPTQRKKAKSSDWELTRPTEGGHVDPVLIPSYGKHVARCIWSGQDLCICTLVCFSTPTQRCYRLLWRGDSRTPTVSTCHGLILGVPAYGRAVALHYSRDQMIVVIQNDLGILYTGGSINGQELFDVATDLWSRRPSCDKAACYIQYLLGSLLFTDKSEYSILWGVCMGCCNTCLLVQEPWSGLAC
ncbi:hypothetical protein M9H77_25189 [Catharanthus roseus]|uniref:Uncharacterized protein n=1 Tax=Catharanthus roseus TaxID=4058 RepID=A0ACC0A6K5_CATRO|nr:hypothetical protein M9H77_25189 [Catharanthus roseus]